MTVLLTIELAVIVAGSVAFAGLYVWRSRWRTSPIGRHMLAFGLAGGFEGLLFLLAVLGVRVPVWMFVVSFGLLDVVVLQRLWLLWRAQHTQAG